MDKHKLSAEMYGILLSLKYNYDEKPRTEDFQVYIKKWLAELTEAGMEMLAEDEREKQNDLFDNQD